MAAGELGRLGRRSRLWRALSCLVGTVSLAAIAGMALMSYRQDIYTSRTSISASLLRSADRGKRDAIVGAISNLTVAEVRPYVASLLASGFKGDKFMLVDETVPPESVRFLRAAGWEVWHNSNVTGKRYKMRGDHFNVERYHFMWWHLSRLPAERYRYLLSFDVLDVVFQSDPLAGMLQRIGRSGHQLLAASESITYGAEIAWGANNLRESFGDAVLEWLYATPVVNAGTFAGRFEVVRDMFLAIHWLSSGYHSYDADQAAYNVLMSMEPYRSLTKVVPSEDGWAAEMGTTLNPSPRQRPLKSRLLEPSPVIGEDNILRTSTGKPFVVVHQYNRVKEFQAAIRKRWESYKPPGF